MSESTKRVFFPATRFFPDTNEQGHVLRDKRGDFKSGIFELTIFESVKEASIFVVKHTENVSWNKYNVLREEIEELDVPQLVEYFKLQDQFDAYLGVNNEKEATSESVQTAGQADGKPGTETPEQEGQSSDQESTEEK